MTERTIELDETREERFEHVREQIDEPSMPTPTDKQVMECLLDTWDAVSSGYYVVNPEVDDDE